MKWAKYLLVAKTMEYTLACKSGPVFCLLLGVSSDYAQPITGQVTEVTCPEIGRAQPELIPSKIQKTGPGLPFLPAFRQYYRKTSSISRTKFQSLNVSCVLLQLSLLNPLKPGVKLRMKM